MLITRFGAVDTADLHSLDGVHYLGAVAPTPGDPLSFASELPGPIKPGTSVKRFEMVAGLRNLNMVDLPNFSA
jgi:hypothetical protein